MIAWILFSLSFLLNAVLALAWVQRCEECDQLNSELDDRAYFG